MNTKNSLKLVGLILILGLFPAQAQSKKLSFNRDIRPILSENCYLCHGFDKKKRKGNLRLDTFEGATKLVKGIAAIVPGRPDQSHMIERIETDDPDDLMPPPDTVYKLNQKEKDLLKQWIREGAEYEEHWALLPLQVEDSKSIDQALKEKREKVGLKVNQSTDPRTLIRRLSFDLRGLPPSAEDVKAFVKNPSDQQYQKIVEKYLKSMEHAEHQALKWLDLVRWANTTGMVSDEPFDSEAYRNYVIQSYYENTPFDTFTIEQLAGDLIKHPTTRSLIASGYNRIVKTNCEAGVIEEEALYDLKGEHVRALGTVWMGITTGCAECHDHKYDPFSQQDYYNMAAFFDDLVEAGCYTPGDRRIPLHYVHQSNEKQNLDANLNANLQKKYSDLYSQTIDNKAYSEWQKQKNKNLKASGNQGDYVWIPAQLPYAHELEGDYQLTDRDGKQVRRVSANSDEVRYHEASELMTGFFETKNVTEKKHEGLYVEVRINSQKKPEWLAIQTLQGAYGRKGWKESEYVTFTWGISEKDYKEKTPTPVIGKIKEMGDMPESDQWHKLMLPKLKGSNWPYIGMAWIQSGGEVDWGDSGLTFPLNKVEQFNMGVAGMRMFHERPYHRMDYQKRFNWPANIVKKHANDRTTTEQELLERCFLEQTNPKLMKEIEQLEYQLAKMRKGSQRVLVSRAGEPKMTSVLPRGDFMDKSGPKAYPAIPAYFGELKAENDRATRLDLAKWLVSPDNPLTARVYVNRLWAQFFGRGFSNTLEDIGSQGEWPSHPELVDQLAKEFIDSGWNVRKMIRKIVNTQSYRLSSIPSSAHKELDAENRYLASQNRFRLHAEAIRDSALSVSGLLYKTSILPHDSKFFHQPDAYWKLSSKVMYGSRHMIWATSQGDEQAYRSVYGFYKRQNAHPTLLAFDGPTRQECSTHRTVTNTPAQALTLLNDPIFVDAAKSMAIKLLKVEGGLQRKLDVLFQDALQRELSETERKTLVDLYHSQYKYFEDAAQEAEALTIDRSSSNKAELAAWIVVSRVVLNLHESITRL